MSYKVGFILSMIFVVMFFLLGSDLVCVQFIYSELDAKSIAISQLIAKHGSLDDDFIEQVENRYDIDFVTADNYAPLFGEEVTYVIAKEYNPVIISDETMTISIERTTVIGYLH